MKKSRNLARFALGALCTLTAVTGFATTAHADDGETPPSTDRKWAVTSDCFNGVGHVYTVYTDSHGVEWYAWGGTFPCGAGNQIATLYY
jgi:hypothetical protein